MLARFTSSLFLRRTSNSANRSTTRRALSDAASPKSPSQLLVGDSGKKATHLHHHMTTFLVFSTPLYLFTPTSYTDGLIDKSFGVLIGTTISAHSWIGLNYVATDYVPKISKTLIGPARVFNFMLGVVTFVGLSKIALNDQGGVKRVVMGLWRSVGEKKK